MRTDTSAEVEPAARVVVVCNTGSGRNDGATERLRPAMEILGDSAELVEIRKGGDIAAAAQAAVAGGAKTVVASGGDGTIMAVVNALAGGDASLGLLPSGTFNFFARGLGIPEEPEAAAHVLKSGREVPQPFAEVNGRVFLNNISLGIYPAILREREGVYRRWGRSRIAAYWSVAKTFLRALRPIRITLIADGQEHELRTPLLFVARSAFQLEHFGLPGAEAVRQGRFVVFVGRREGRLGLFRQAWHLIRGKMQEGRDFDLIEARSLEIRSSRKRLLVAIDGEKARLAPPLKLQLRDGLLKVIMPRESQ